VQVLGDYIRFQILFQLKNLVDRVYGLQTVAPAGPGRSTVDLCCARVACSPEWARAVDVGRESSPQEGA
jgi:hypothetical protein